MDRLQHFTLKMQTPSPTKEHPRLAPPTPTTPSIHTSRSSTLLHSPSSPGPLSGRATSGSPHRTLRKLASAHSLGYGSAASLRASIANPPALLAQQRLHHQPPARRIAAAVSPTRRNATSLPTSGALDRSSPRDRANSDALILRQLTAAAAAMSSTALRNSGALNGRSAYDHIPLEKLIRDGPPDGNWDNAVECARLKVLQQEIKSDSDGMVCMPTVARRSRTTSLGTSRSVKLANACHHPRTVKLAYLRLADHA